MVIDTEGFRANVGIVICNAQGQLLWAKRIGQDAWQFPQGGIKSHESLDQALFRELDEEVGLQPGDVRVLHKTSDWLYYHLPEQFIRRNNIPRCIGQKQKWVLLSLETEEHNVVLSNSSTPEFDGWRWVEYWHPVDQVIEFKRDVYRQALNQLLDPLNEYLEQQAVAPSLVPPLTA